MGLSKSHSGGARGTVGTACADRGPNGSEPLGLDRRDVRGGTDAGPERLRTSQTPRHRRRPRCARLAARARLRVRRNEGKPARPRLPCEAGTARSRHCCHTRQGSVDVRPCSCRPSPLAFHVALTALNGETSVAVDTTTPEREQMPAQLPIGVSWTDQLPRIVEWLTERDRSAEVERAERLWASSNTRLLASTHLTSAGHISSALMARRLPTPVRPS